MRLTRGVTISSAVAFLLLTSNITLCEAFFESRCAVENTVVNFHCPDSGGWRINFLPTWTSGPVTFTTNDETGLKEDMHIVTNQVYLQTYGNVSLITCLSREGQSSFAIVAITAPSQPELQLFPTLTRQSWTSLYLEWESPEYDHDLPYVDYHYTITMHGDDGYFEVISVSVNGSETPGLYLDLGGYECVQLHIYISLPGNCVPTRIPAALLLDPLYPMPRGVEVVVLNTTSLALTWQHPENLFSDDHFNYSVSAVVVSTGDVIRQYTISLNSSHTPWEEFDLSGSVHACEEINFTLSLVGDCRVIHTTTVLPAYPEELNVGVLFSVDLSLKKIEIVFTPPTAMFCNFQTSRYLLSYSDGNTTWFTEPKTISHSSQLVKVGIDTGLKVDTYYTITVTILTDAGNISSTTNFSLITPTEAESTELSAEKSNAGLLVYVLPVAAVVAIAVLGGVIGVITMVCCLNQKKRKREEFADLSEMRDTPILLDSIRESVGVQ